MSTIRKRKAKVKIGVGGLLGCDTVRIPFRVPPRDARPFDVAGVGLNSIDLVAVVAEYPESNTKQRLQRFARLPGGQSATALTVCARLGWKARYVGSFGDDELGQLSRVLADRQGAGAQGRRHRVDRDSGDPGISGRALLENGR